MSKKVKLWLAPIAIVAAYLCGGQRAIALERKARAFPVGETDNNSESIYIASAKEEEDLAVLEQVTSVSQLSDVQPTDWAFQALQSLVERYGCIAGYPDGTYRGNRAMTRFEFAAGLNACLDRITELIASSTAELVTREDLSLLQRLQEEFAAELATLRGRVDVLEGRTAEIEANQFSTTTKLNGFVTFGLEGVLAGDDDSQLALNQSTFLLLTTSFTGQDLLITGIAASNNALPAVAPFNAGRNVGPTREGTNTWIYGGSTGSTFILPQLEYVFPVINNEEEKLYVTISSEFGFNAAGLFLPIASSWEGYQLNSGPVSAFAQRNPFYRLGGGQGVIVNYNRGPFLLTGVYLATDGSDSREGKGLFNGDYSAVGQLTFAPSNNFAIAFAYGNRYFGPGRFAFNNQYKFGPDTPGYVGTALANRFDNAGVFFDEDVPVISDAYGLQVFYQVNPKLVILGFVTKVDAKLIGRGNADIWSYALSLTFPDLGKEGNVGGLIVGVEPTLTGLQINDEFVGGFERDTSLHVEGFYRYQASDNISITPAIVWITAPNQDAENEDLIFGTIRTTFSF